jgi:hypothetical protein
MLLVDMSNNWQRSSWQRLTRRPSQRRHAWQPVPRGRLIAFGDASLKDPFGRKPCVQIALDDLDLSQQESWVQFAAPHPINECGLDNETDVPGRKNSIA